MTERLMGRLLGFVLGNCSLSVCCLTEEAVEA